MTHQVSHPKSIRHAAKGGFTLLEIIVTIVILAIVSVIAMNIFSTTLFAWKRSVEVAEGMQHY